MRVVGQDWGGNGDYPVDGLALPERWELMLPITPWIFSPWKGIISCFACHTVYQTLSQCSFSAEVSMALLQSGSYTLGKFENELPFHELPNAEMICFACYVVSVMSMASVKQITTTKVRAITFACIMAVTQEPQ